MSEDLTEWPRQRRAVVRDAVGIGVATGAYGLSFGALATAGGLTVAQTCALSLLMFTGGSQFAFVGVVTVGGGLVAAISTAVLLGSRNALYGLRLATLLKLSGWRRFVGAQLVIDESSAMAIGKESGRAGRLGFWATGAAVFVLWNLATLIGAVAAAALPDPEALGLDAAAPAAFLALLAPKVRARGPWTVAIGAALVALLTTPFLPAGIPVLLAAVVAVIAVGLGVR